jgi:hypothetical protein
MNPKHSNIPLIGILVAVLVMLGTTGAAASSGTKITNCSKALSSPTSVTLTCADGNTLLTKLRWSSFGGPTATAKGTFQTNTCKPNCASGKVVKYPATIKASGRLGCKGGVRVYARLSIAFSGKVPSYVSSYKSWTFRCPS